MSRAVDHFRARFKAAGDAERAVSQRAYMKSALQFHGVEMATVRAECAAFSRLEPLDHDALVAEVNALYATDFFDLHSAGVGLLERNLGRLGTGDAAWVISLVRRSACWAHVDWLATKVVPRVIPAKPEKELKAWARDDDFWVRRTALLAQLDALRAGGGDFALFTELAVPMLPEKEFFIRKALGWVLRDTSKKRPALVREFVNAHRASMSGLTLREATKRLAAAP